MLGLAVQPYSPQQGVSGGVPRANRPPAHPGERVPGTGDAEAVTAAAEVLHALPRRSSRYGFGRPWPGQWRQTAGCFPAAVERIDF